VQLLYHKVLPPFSDEGSSEYAIITQCTTDNICATVSLCDSNIQQRASTIIVLPNGYHFTTHIYAAYRKYKCTR